MWQRGVGRFGCGCLVLCLRTGRAAAEKGPDVQKYAPITRGRRSRTLRTDRIQDSQNNIKGVDEDLRMITEVLGFRTGMRVTGAGLHHRTNLSIKQNQKPGLFPFFTFDWNQTRTDYGEQRIYQMVTRSLFVFEFAHRSRAMQAQ